MKAVIISNTFFPNQPGRPRQHAYLGGFSGLDAGFVSYEVPETIGRSRRIHRLCVCGRRLALGHPLQGRVTSDAKRRSQSRILLGVDL